MVGIPMGTNSAPLLADLFPYSYENEFLDKLIKECKRKLARKFNLSYRYTDDLISFNNKRFKEFIHSLLLNPEHLVVLLAGPISHTSTQYIDFVEFLSKKLPHPSPPPSSAELDPYSFK